MSTITRAGKPIRYTRSAEVELELHGGEVAVRFCDASVAQWDEPLGDLDDCADEELVGEIADLIRLEASDMAKSLVKDLRERVMKAGDGS